MLENGEVDSESSKSSHSSSSEGEDDSFLPPEEDESSHSYLHSPLESMLIMCFVIWFPWKLNMCCLGDLDNMIEMLSTMGLLIIILSCIKVKR